MTVLRVWVAVMGLALAGSLAAGASGRAAGARPAHSAQSQDGVVRVSLDQAVQMVEARYKARVVRADTRTEDGRVVYVMRLLDRHGRVFTVQVDASSGTIL